MGILCGILSVPQNIVIDLNKVMFIDMKLWDSLVTHMKVWTQKKIPSNLIVLNS